jgi:hypothetical protein
MKQHADALPDGEALSLAARRAGEDEIEGGDT